MMKQSKQTTTEVTTTTLTPVEEKVVRMRHGLTAPDTMKLSYHGEGDSALAEKLAEMEKRAFEAVGARTTTQKRKIVSALRRKGS